MNEIFSQSVENLALKIKNSELTSVELCEKYIERIDEFEKEVKAWAFFDKKILLEKAKEADDYRRSGKPIGFLHGIPVAVKDIIGTVEMPTECGTSIRKGKSYSQNAEIIDLLISEGAIVMGKTATSELAFLGPPKTTNPHDYSRTPGGSSSGSAASVASYMAPLSIGSQTGGSVIRPASYCGVVGYKPTYGLISRNGVLRTSQTLDHIGMFGRNVEDVALLAKALIKLGDNFKQKDHEIFNKLENISGKIIDGRKNAFPGEVISDFLQENKNFFPKLEEFANQIFDKVKQNNRTRYIALCQFLKDEYGITVKDVIPKEGKPFSKIYKVKDKELYLSDYLSLETKKLFAAAQISQEGASKEIDEYLTTFNFPTEESKKLTRVALLNYCGAAILMPYSLFHKECKELKYDLELLQNTFATSFEQVAHRVTCLQDPKLPGIPFHFLRVDVAGNISKRFSLSGIEIPRYGGACPRWNVYSAFSRPGVIQAAVSKMTNGEKYVCIAKTVEKEWEGMDNLKVFYQSV